MHPTSDLGDVGECDNVAPGTGEISPDNPKTNYIIIYMFISRFISFTTKQIVYSF